MYSQVFLTRYLMQKESGGTHCIGIMPELPSSPPPSLLRLIRAANEQCYIFYIRLLYDSERYPYIVT
jgi:hypothetical protein